MPRSLPVLLAVAALAIAACAPGTTAPIDPELGFRWTLLDQGHETIFPGQVAEYTIRVDSKVNLNSRVNLSALCQPRGLVLAFDPPRIPETASQATLRVSTTPETPFGGFIIEVMAVEDGVPSRAEDAQRTFLRLAAHGDSEPHATVLVAPAEVTLTESIDTALLIVRLTSQNGFRGPVALAMTGVTDDLRILAFPASADLRDAETSDSLLLQFVPQGPVSTPVILTLTANAGGVERSASIRVNLPQTSAPGQ